MTAGEKQQRAARFWRKFLRLTRGRVTVLRALQLAAEEESHAIFRETLTAVYRAVESGSLLSEALKQHPDHFSPSVVELVRTAEKTGAWDEILIEIADGLAEGTFA